MRLIGWILSGLAAGGVLLAVRQVFAAAASSQSAPGIDTSAGVGHEPPGWTPADYVEVNKLGSDIQSSGPDLLLIMFNESGLNPAARFPKLDAAGHSLAVAINQLTAASDPVTGLTEDQRDALSKKSVSEQLPYVRKFFLGQQWTKEGRTFPSAGVLYAVNFLPSRAISRGVLPDTVLGTLAEFPLNTGLADGSGNFTVRHLNEVLARKAQDPRYLGALAAMRDAVGDQSLSPRTS